VTTELPPLGDRLRQLGTLGDNPDPEAVQTYLGNARAIVGDLEAGDRELARSTLVQQLKDAGVHGPARVVDRYLNPSPPGGRHAARSSAGTLPPGVVDVVRDGDALAWLTVESGKPEIVAELEGTELWPAAALPWKPIPDAALVQEALTDGAPAPFADLTAHLARRVVLPEPPEPWAALLAAWVLGTYLLARFVYYPLLLLEGPAERGKTRLGKALLWPAFRGLYTPSPTPATLFRDRAHHRVTLGLDVEDLPAASDRSDLGDLILNSFERDGVVRRCTRPDAPPPAQVETFAVYGATILTTNRTLRPESPLASRCLRVPLPGAGGVRVPDAATPEEAADLRARAVAWAARVCAGQVELPEVEPPFTGRMRDLTAPLLRVLGAVAPEALPGVLELLGTLDRDRRTDAGSSWEARVAVALWDSRSKLEGGRLYIEDLTAVVNEGLPEGQRLAPQNVGVARRNLGLAGGRGGRRGRAYVAWPGDEQARALRDRYFPPEDPVEPSASSASSETLEPQGLSLLRASDSTLSILSTENPRPISDAEDREDAEGSQRGENGSILEEADRLWEAAYELDAALGDSSATTYAAACVRELGKAPEPAAVTALADKLEVRLRQERTAP
jgi:hypothetical protein